MTEGIHRDAEPLAWLVRGGEQGEHENIALARGLIIVAWSELGSIEHCSSREQVRAELHRAYPDTTDKIIGNWTGQLWRFKEQIQIGHLVVMPLKTRPGRVAIGRVTGPYSYLAEEPAGFRQTRPVEWLSTDVSREAFKPDLRASITSLLTVCGLNRKKAAKRIAHLVGHGTDPGIEGSEEVTSSDELLASAASQALTSPRRLTIRDFLEHWGETRRTGAVVARIKADLAEAGLTTRPPFTEGSVEDEIELVPDSGEPGSRVETADDTEDVSAQAPSTLRIGSLPPAKLLSVPPEASLAYAKTLMLNHKFSQLAVIDDNGVLHGAISWESIGKAHIASPTPELTDAIAPAAVVDHDALLLDQVDVIYDRGFVFVRHTDRATVDGIVTAADLTRQFGAVSRPFVLIEETEIRLRRRINEACSLEELQRVVPPYRRNRVRQVNDLTFGEYQSLLQSREQWAKLGWNIDHEFFLDLLDKVRRIRNEIMHFAPEPLSARQYADVEGLLELLRTVDPRP